MFRGNALISLNSLMFSLSFMSKVLGGLPHPWMIEKHKNYFPGIHLSAHLYWFFFFFFFFAELKSYWTTSDTKSWDASAKITLTKLGGPNPISKEPKKDWRRDHLASTCAACSIDHSSLFTSPVHEESEIRERIKKGKLGKFRKLHKYTVTGLLLL